MRHASINPTWTHIDAPVYICRPLAQWHNLGDAARCDMASIDLFLAMGAGGRHRFAAAVNMATGCALMGDGQTRQGPEDRQGAFERTSEQALTFIHLSGKWTMLQRTFRA